MKVGLNLPKEKSELEQAIVKLADLKKMVKKEIVFYSKATEIDESHIEVFILRMVYFKEAITNVKLDIQNLKTKVDIKFK